jgi:hypothetical protein
MEYVDVSSTFINVLLVTKLATKEACDEGKKCPLWAYMLWAM